MIYIYLQAPNADVFAEGVLVHLDRLDRGAMDGALGRYLDQQDLVLVELDLKF